MSGPIHIDPKLVHILDPHRFNLLLIDLLRAEIGRIGLSPGALDATVAVSVPDGGIDLRLHRSSSLTGNDSSWLPIETSAWQLKSGRCPPIRDIALVEMHKPEVSRSIQDGQYYCFVTADSITPNALENIEGAILSRFWDLDCEPKYLILSGDKLTSWIEEFPAIARRFFDVPIEGWDTFEQWELPERLHNPWQADSSRETIIQAVRQAVAQRERIIRVSGYAGMGKTRTVLEALRIAGVKERVLYLDDASNLNPDFLWYIRQSNSTGSGILVVDECTTDLYVDLRSRAEALPKGFTVVAIGPHGIGEPRGTFEMGPLAIEPLAEILKFFTPGLSTAARTAIVARCGGSPKLVVLLASLVGSSDSDNRPWEELELNPDVLAYVNRRVFPLGTDDPQARLMRGLSLFTRVGWRDDLSEEGKHVAAFVGVDWTTARSAAEQLVARGVVSRRGRFLYPTPDVLANYLTRETIRLRSVDELRDLFNQVSDSGRTAFADRLRQLGDEAESRQIVEVILGDEGFFRSWNDFAQQRSARLFLSLAPGFPTIALARLESALEGVSAAELQAFKAGRREVMWALEGLAWWAETFPVVARLIRKLALAENEDIANNATGIWERLFQVVLGGTATPFRDRLPVLRETLRSEEPQARILGLKALGAALKTQDLHRVGGPPTDTWRLPPQEWKPATYAVWFDLLLEVLKELEPLLSDPEEIVRNEAIQVLVDRGSDLMASDLVVQWSDLARRFVGAPFSVRAKLLEVAEWRLDHSEGLSQVALATLTHLASDLAGISFEDRLKRSVGLHEYEAISSRADQRDLIKDLAREMIATPQLVESNLSWLLGGEANSSLALGRDLGELDTGMELLPLVMSRMADNGADDRLASGYLLGVANRLGAAWLEKELDALETQGLTRLVAAIIWRSGSNDGAARRLARLISSGRIQGNLLLNFSMGSWSHNLSAEALRELLTAGKEHPIPESAAARLLILEQYLGKYPERVSAFSDLIFEVLEQTAGVRVTAMDSYEWKHLAERVVAKDPVRIASICLAVYIDEKPVGRTEDIRSVLDKALELGGWPVFEQVIAPAILASPILTWQLDSPFRATSVFTVLAENRLIEWIGNDVDSRLPLVAQRAKPFGKPLAGLARTLLINWGERDDVKSAMAASFGTGTWWGPESNWIRGQMDELSAWALDEDPKISAWARDLLRSYQYRLDKALVFEEEEHH